VLIPEAIGLGLVASLLFTEAIGFAAGDSWCPATSPLHLDRPLQVLSTVAAALLTLLCIKLAGRIFLL